MDKEHTEGKGSAGSDSQNRDNGSFDKEQTEAEGREDQSSDNCNQIFVQLPALQHFLEICLVSRAVDAEVGRTLRHFKLLGTDQL